MKYQAHLNKLDEICLLNIYSQNSVGDLNLQTFIARSDREISESEAKEIYDLIEEVRKAYCKLGNKTFEIIKKYREGNVEPEKEDEYI